MPDTEELSALANDVRMVCQQISRRVRFEGTPEVAPHQFSVLVKLRHRAWTPGELAEVERVSPPSMTRTVNCLVADGLASNAIRHGVAEEPAATPADFLEGIGAEDLQDDRAEAEGRDANPLPPPRSLRLEYLANDWGAIGIVHRGQGFSWRR